MLRIGFFNSRFHKAERVILREIHRHHTVSKEELKAEYKESFQNRYFLFSKIFCRFESMIFYLKARGYIQESTMNYGDNPNAIVYTNTMKGCDRVNSYRRVVSLR